MEEMRKSENSISLQDKIFAKADFKREKSELIIVELTYFQNIDFKKRVVEFLFWIMLQSSKHSYKIYTFGA